MLGYQIESQYLIIKKAAPPTDEELAQEMAGHAAEVGEIFQQIIEDKSSNVIVLKNCVSL